MSLEDKYIPINKLEYKNEKIILPKTVYIKESYIDEQDKIGAMKAVFNELTNEPDTLFKLMKIMCETKISVSITIDTSQKPILSHEYTVLSDQYDTHTTVRNKHNSHTTIHNK